MSYRLWRPLMAGHLSKKGDRLFKLEGAVIHRSSNGTDGGRRTKHVSSNTLFPRGSNPHAVSPTTLEASPARQFDPKGYHLR